MAALASDWLRHFRLLLWKHRTEFNENWQEARSQRPLPSLCFSGRSEKQNGCPGLWLAETFSTSPLLPLNRIQRHLTWSKISTSSTKFVFFGLIKKKIDGRPGLWLAETFSTFLKPLNEIQRNLTGSKIYTSSTKFVFFEPIGKKRWPPWPLIRWDIFDFSSETTKRNSTKLDSKKDLNVLYQVWVFGPMGKTRWPPRPIRRKGGSLYSGARYVALWASCCWYGTWLDKRYYRFGKDSAKWYIQIWHGRVICMARPFLCKAVRHLCKNCLCYQFTWLDKLHIHVCIHVYSAEIIWFLPLINYGITRFWMIFRHKLYHFTVANLVLLQRVGFCDSNMIQFKPENHSITNLVITILIHSAKTRFHIFVTLLRRVAKDVTSSILSWHKRYGFNVAKFPRHSPSKCALQT